MCRRRIVRPASAIGSGRPSVRRRGPSGSGRAALDGDGRQRCGIRALASHGVRSAGSRVPSPNGTRDAAPADEHRPRTGEPPAALADLGGRQATVTAPSHHQRLTSGSPAPATVTRNRERRVSGTSTVVAGSPNRVPVVLPGIRRPDRPSAGPHPPTPMRQPRNSVSAPTQAVIRQPIAPMTARKSSPPIQAAAATPPNRIARTAAMAASPIRSMSGRVWRAGVDRSSSSRGHRRPVVAHEPAPGRASSGRRRSGAATSPPRPACSTSTAMATVGCLGRREPDEPRVRLARATELGRARLAGRGDARDLRAGRELPPESPSTASTIAALIVAGVRGDDDPAHRARGRSSVAPLLPVIDVTSRGRISSPSLATVDATSAIWSGVTNVSAWPYAALASSTSSANPPGSDPSPLVTCETAVGRSNGSGAPKPIRSAKSTRSAPPVSRPVSAYQMLHETSVASTRSSALEPVCGMVAVADAEALDEQAVPPRPGLLLDTSSSGVIAPEPRPATAVTILNTEPGTYRPSVARGRSGCVGSSCRASNVAAAVAGSAMRRRVVGRRRGEREDLAGPRIEHDDRAAPLAERRDRGPLEVVRQRQRQVLGVVRGRRRTCAKASVERVAGEAGQLGVVRPLEAGAAVAAARRSRRPG